MPQLFSVSVHPVLHPAMAVEELGGGQDYCPHDGSGRGGRLRGTVTALLRGIPRVTSRVVQHVYHVARKSTKLEAKIFEPACFSCFRF